MVATPASFPFPAPVAPGAEDGQLAPRIPLLKRLNGQLEALGGGSGRLVVKFLDAVKARPTPDGTVLSLVNQDLSQAADLAVGANIEFTPSIKLPQESLSVIESKAAAYSKRAQPDLGGMMYVTTRDGGPVPLEVAQALNDLDFIEFVYFEPTYVEDNGPMGACCLLGAGGHFTECQELDPGTCAAMGGVYNGDGTMCPDPDNPACGDLCAGDCFVINGTPGCEDVCDGDECESCCQLVCDLDPFCCETDPTWPGRGAPRWDPWCVEHARVLCPGTPTDLCGNPNAGPCEESHPETIGCSNQACCEAVCSVEPTCCTTQWDALCAATAIEVCLPADPNAQTPSFADTQGYLSPLSYVDDFGGLPINIIPGLQFDVDGILLDGYQGQGYDMQGLWEFGELLLDIGVGEENLTRGKGIRVGIVEFAAFVDSAVGPDEPYRHEDLHGKVIPEPGQTILIHSAGTGHHGTATLGIVGAIDHDDNGNEEPDGLSPDESRAQERGVVGLAPEADLYFFPIVSVEEGGRLLGAMASALFTFEPGDVLSFSIGPAGCGTLASDQGTWLLLRLAADSGIMCCISAGNDCCSLSGSDFGQIGSIDGMVIDSDVTIVGAVYPGRGAFNVYCRLGFSNHCDGCAEPDAVHTSAWGTSVATLGYGSMFFPNGDRNRSYTNGFGGTSAAAPQVAALAACLQGLSKQRWGIPLLPRQIRELLSGNGWGQCGYVFLEDRPGNAADEPCLGDWDFDQGQNHIGVWLPSEGEVGAAYSDPLLAAKGLVAASIFDCKFDDFLESMEIYRGTHIFGNLNSLRCPDGLTLIIKSQYTEPTDNIDLGIVYLAPGHITDVMVAARAEEANPANLQMNIQSTLIPQGNFTSLFLIFGELYNFNQNRWVLIGFDLVNVALDGSGPFLFQYVPNGGAAGFVREGDNRVLMRAWTLTLGGNFGGGFGGGTPNTAHVVRHDWIGLDFTPDDGGPVIP